MTNVQPLLLDTCALIFIAEGLEISAEAKQAVEAAGGAGMLHLSPISAWEIGRAVASGSLRITVPPTDYFSAFLDKAGATLCDMGADILIGSSFLPGNVHKDPMDRIIIETARRNQLTILTRDRAIGAYANDGHVKYLHC